MASYDLVIRGGTIVDGTGGALYDGDVAVVGGRIVAVGAATGVGHEEIDARGKLVTPGFVDIHTHYDGQVTWEHRLAPSSNHGVTTVVMGNCGVGFAPCRPGDQAMMIKLMEGVEDIPGVVMEEGVPWNWETFPDYLDAIEQRHMDVDFAAQLPHSALRVYVMGERGANLAPPTADELDEMRRLTAEAISAGALGVSTSRTLVHRFPDGRSAPSVGSEDEELLALARGLRDAGAGVFQVVPNIHGSADEEFAIFRKIVEASDRPLTFSLVNLSSERQNWLTFLKHLDEAGAAQEPISAQFIPRPAGFLFGLDLSTHPFCLNPSYRPIANLPLAEKVRIMRDPDFRARLITEEPDDPNPTAVQFATAPRQYFELGDPPVYSQPPENSVAAKAEALGISLREALYDALMAQDGKAVLYAPSSNNVPVTIAEARPMFERENAVMGLGDGGAHYGFISDATMPTYLLTDWVRDAKAPQLDLPLAIKALTSEPAAVFGLHDRGTIKAGAKADLNVIDLDRLHLHAPSVVRDLPAGGRRIVQGSDGYVATIVSGVVTYREGIPSGALPGRLIRGARQAASI
ncbi:amidohydrolase family protein [Sphingomonadaceae bacterium G21617-S1]|nr:amidohydrolase family protein [Sphingomonadaceae bacterium G21617-S1]